MIKLISSIVILCSLAGISANLVLKELVRAKIETQKADCRYRLNMLASLPIETQGNLREELRKSILYCNIK